MKTEQFFFNLDVPGQGIERELAPGLHTRIFVGQQAMLSFVTLAPHAAGPLHAHAEEQWGVMLEGDGVRIQDGAEVAVRVGDFWYTPGGLEHGFDVCQVVSGVLGVDD